MPPAPKTTGQTIASNLHACQIISGRDTERVAKQIDAHALAVAQTCLAQWIRELDSELANADLGFDEGMGAGQAGDAEAAAGAFLRSRQAVKNARARLATALALGV